MQDGRGHERSSDLSRGVFFLALTGMNSLTREALASSETPGEASAPREAWAGQDCPAAPSLPAELPALQAKPREGSTKRSCALLPPLPEWGQHLVPPHHVPLPPLEQAPGRAAGICKPGSCTTFPAAPGPRAAPRGKTPLQNGVRWGALAG